MEHPTEVIRRRLSENIQQNLHVLEVIAARVDFVNPEAGERMRQCIDSIGESVRGLLTAWHDEHLKQMQQTNSQLGNILSTLMQGGQHDTKTNADQSS